MKTLLGLFGPPRAGKNTVINLINQITGNQWEALSISAEIKKYSHQIVRHEFKDKEKDTPQEILGGKTPRDLYIYIGQLDEFRNDLWTSPIADWVYNVDHPKFVIESVGKQHQFNTLLTRKPCPRIILCEVHQEGRVYDSRGPIQDTRPIFRIENPATVGADLSHLVPQVERLLEWVEQQDPR